MKNKEEILVMGYKENIIVFLKNYLPPTAEIIKLEIPYKKLAICIADLDEDKKKEIVVGYKWREDSYILILKNYNRIWHVASNIRRRGYDLNYLDIKPFMNKEMNNLIIGWQGEGILSELNILQYKDGKLKKVVEEIYYSKEEENETKEDITELKRREMKLYPASIKEKYGTKWGYINEKGEFVIHPKYDYAYNFQDNHLAIVEYNENYGVIDSSGNYIIDPKYSFITEFSEGLGVVVDENGFRVIDENGKEITKKTYPYIGSFKEDRGIFEEKKEEDIFLYGYLNKEGKEIIPPKYENASDFQNGKAVVKIKDGEYAQIDGNGDILKKYKYDFVGNAGDGLLVFQEKERGKYGYIDENGEIVISPTYTSAEPFNQERAVVNIGEDYKDKYGLIDKKGNFIIKPEYNSIERLGENRMAVGIPINEENPFMGMKYAIHDIQGEKLTDFIYDGVSKYKNKLASAYDDEYTFFIDESGNKMKNLPIVSGSGTLSFVKDLIKADVDYRTFYIDKEGKIIYKQNTIIPLSEEYEVREEKFKPNKDYLVYYPQIDGVQDKKVEKSINEKLKYLSQIKDIKKEVQLDYEYSGDFTIEFFKKDLLVLELFGYEYPFGAAHGMPTRIYPHINLKTGRFYELKDLFKKNSDYISILSHIIKSEIKNNEKYDDIWPDSFKEIKKDQSFYVGKDALYIYFTPYEIAPYAAGFPTFKIPYEDIMSSIDLKGEFWKSFNVVKR